MIKNKEGFIFAILLSFAVLTGCAAQEIVYVDRIVEVPQIIMEPRPELPEVIKLTDLPIYHLTKDSTPEEVARAYYATVEILKSKIKQYEEVMLILDEED